MTNHEQTHPYTSDHTYHEQESGDIPATPKDDLELLRFLAEHGDTNSDLFAEILDNISFEYVRTNFSDIYNENLKIINSRAISPDEKRAAAASNRELLKIAKGRILTEFHIADVVVDEFDAARQKIESIIETDYRVHGDKSLPLHALGILVKDKDGKDRYVYPHNLFPSSTNELWHSYVRAVKSHVQAADDLSGQKTGSSQGIVKATDLARKSAHDAISRDIRSLLNFPDTEEGFQEARSLVAKMRETRFTSTDTGERHRLQDRILSRSGKVVELLRELNELGMLSDPEAKNYR